jgi:hypothetical protein
VEIEFEPRTLDKADPFDPSWLLDTENHCREADATAPGGLGPFGVVVLASENLEEHTAVHFRVYKAQHKHMILMCSDLRRLINTYGFASFFLACSHQLISESCLSDLHCINLSKNFLFHVQVVPETRAVHASLWRLL